MIESWERRWRWSLEFPSQVGIVADFERFPHLTNFPRKYKFYGFPDRIELIKNKTCFELKQLDKWFIRFFDRGRQKKKKNNKENNYEWRNAADIEFAKQRWSINGWANE